MTLFQSCFWPDVSSRKNPLAAINETFWATLFLAALMALFTFIAVARDGQPVAGLLGFSNTALLSAIAFVIGGKSHIVAVAGFGLYVRGTVALHRFAPIVAGLPSIEGNLRSFGQGAAKTQQQECEPN